VNRLILGTLLATGLGLCFASSKALGAGERQRSLRERADVVEVSHGGRTRTALVYVPSSYDGKKPVPLVLSFHGRHGQGKDQASLTEFHRLGERQNFIVVYPDGVGKSWNARHGTGEAEARGIDDVGYVDALLKMMLERYQVDQNRIYASGMSNGGFFAHRLGCERSNRFAAIATVAGEMAPALEKVCRPERPVPVLIFHGTRDRIVPYGGGKTEGGGSLLSADRTAEVWSRLNGASGPPRETFRKGDVVCRSYEDGKAPVTLCSVGGAGHTWPGGDQYAPRLLVGSTNRDVNATEMIWDFFEANPKR
jgi:polyhydroxybutyrate depolymerase